MPQGLGSSIPPGNESSITHGHGSSIQQGHYNSIQQGYGNVNDSSISQHVSSLPQHGSSMPQYVSSVHHSSLLQGGGSGLPYGFVSSTPQGNDSSMPQLVDSSVTSIPPSTFAMTPATPMASSDHPQWPLFLEFCRMFGLGNSNMAAAHTMPNIFPPDTSPVNAPVTMATGNTAETLNPMASSTAPLMGASPPCMHKLQTQAIISATYPQTSAEVSSIQAGFTVAPSYHTAHSSMMYGGAPTGQESLITGELNTLFK